MTTAITQVFQGKSDILPCQKLSTKVEGIFSIRCAIGVRKNRGSGQLPLQIRGEPRVISVIIGNRSSDYWISKLV